MTLSVLNTGVFNINTYIIELCEKRALIIDPAACHYTHDEDKITSYIKSHDLTPLAVFLTHGHFDHIMGTAVLKSSYPAIALCCNSEDEFMAGSNAAAIQSAALGDMGLMGLVSALKGLPDMDITFSGGDTFCDVLTKGRNIGNDSKNYSGDLLNALSDWTIISTPGHTKGSSCFYNAREKTLITGDTIFFQSYGRCDLPGGSERSMQKSLKSIYKTIPHDTKVYPAHEEYGFLLEENL